MQAIVIFYAMSGIIVALYCWLSVRSYENGQPSWVEPIPSWAFFITVMIWPAMIYLVLKRKWRKR